MVGRWSQWRAPTDRPGRVRRRILAIVGGIVALAIVATVIVVQIRANDVQTRLDYISSLSPEEAQKYLEEHPEMIAEMANAESAHTARWWRLATPAERKNLIATAPEITGALDGVPYGIRDYANREVLDKLIARETEQLKTEPDNGQARQTLEALKAIKIAINGKREVKRYLILLVDEELPLAAVAVGNLDSAEEMEELWQETETHLAAALDAVEAGTVLDLPAETATLRRAIALHFMRRDQVKDSFGTSLDKARVGITAPPDFHGDPAAFRTAVRARLDDERAATFTENLRALFDKAESLASRSQLEVVHSEAPLLVGDTAVVSIRRDGGVGFIPFSDAATHVLPVGRHHLVALAKESRMLELSEAWAHRLNEQQILNARERVFFHPDDPLESFVREVRDRHQASQSKDVPRPPT